MKKIVFLLLLALSLFLVLNESTYAKSNEEQPTPLEKSLPEEIGYKTIIESVKEFEEHFKKDLKLPLRIPPITFTHQFGRFSDLEGESNDNFELFMISDQLPENRYQINIRPIEHKLPMKSKYVLDTYKLNNGNDATYLTISGSNALVFERDSWQYMLSFDKRISDVVTPEVLVDIANSIDYPSERKE